MIRERKIINLIKRGFTLEQIKAEIPDYISTKEVDDFFDKLLSTTKQIVNLTLQGFSDKDISNILEMSMKEVSEYLNCIIQSQSGLYDAEVSPKILKLRKDASLQKRLELYKKLMALDEKKCDLSEIATIKEIKIFQKLKKRIIILKQFVKNGCRDTLEHVAYQCELNESSVCQILREKDDFQILDNFLTSEEKQKLTDYYQKLRKDYVASRTISNLFDNKSSIDNYEEDYSKIGKRINYWCQIALTYRLSLYNLCQILKYHNREGLKKFILSSAPSQYYIGLRYLFEVETAYVEYLRNKEHLTVDEEQKVKGDDALKEQYIEDVNHVLWYQMIQNKADKKKNENITDEKEAEEKKKAEKKYREIMRRLNDQDYKDTIKKHLKAGVYWTDEDIASVATYKIKYCLTFKNIPAPRNTIVARCPEELKEDLISCNAYQDEFFKKALKRKKKDKKNE